MNPRKRVVGQILVAVGGTMALGGVATFLFPNANIELRSWTGIVSTAEARMAWIGINAVVAGAGLRLVYSAER